MPNHCENSLILCGPKESVDRFKEIIESSKEPTMSIIKSHFPVPEELANVTATFGRSDKEDEMYKKYGFHSWYDWCIENWGTKWGDYNTELFEESSFVYDSDLNATTSLWYKYDTAWGPANDGILHISSLFPDILFFTRYREEGMCFEGIFKCINGEVLEDVSSDMLEDESSYFHNLDCTYDRGILDEYTAI